MADLNEMRRKRFGVSMGWGVTTRGPSRPSRIPDPNDKLFDYRDKSPYRSRQQRAAESALNEINDEEFFEEE